MEVKRADLSPMMQQYWGIKDQYPDAFVLFRLGDFYELFFDDAVHASKLLDLVLTGRDCGLPERAPMCGIPFHSRESYIARLVGSGHKIAICEQVESQELSDGSAGRNPNLMMREVVRVVTPGTLYENELLDAGRNNYLSALLVEEEGVGVVFCDVSTGSIIASQFTGEAMIAQLLGEIAKYQPTEVLLSPRCLEHAKLRVAIKQLAGLVNQLPEEAFALDAAIQCVEAHFADIPEEESGLSHIREDSFALRALGTALTYLKKTMPAGCSNLRQVDAYSERQFLQLDVASRRNLELCETLRTREKKGSLLAVLDRCESAMGKRLLRSWLEAPMVHLPRITKRQEAVRELVARPELREDLRRTLKTLHDFERLMSKVMYQSANPRDLLAVGQSLHQMPMLRNLLSGIQSAYLRQQHKEIDPLEDVARRVETALVTNPPILVKDGGIFRDGFYAELDDIRAIQRDGEGFLATAEISEQKRLGVKKLKIGFNRVFGYYIEIPNAYLAFVPEEYTRKQTLANCERYITPELKEMEAKVLSAAERGIQMEHELFVQLREEIAQHYARIRRSAAAAAVLDVLCSFAEVAAAQQYVCPVLTMGNELEIKEGRHPVVEAVQREAPFVANDTTLTESARCMVITGPNMAGKSTYMRQVALITLMAQIGSFVPAASATIGVVDAIFTRVGASDDLASGQSTFMIEMTEVAQILRNATARSLLIYDEIGRGTSTFDGMSIARAVLEFSAEEVRARTLFATHYHELTELEHHFAGVHNYTVAVKKHGEEITFLRRITRGTAPGSYGIDVAQLAGLPPSVLARARQCLRDIERESKFSAAGSFSQAPETQEIQEAQEAQRLAVHRVLDLLRGLNIEAITPLEALLKLQELVQMAQETN